MVSIRRQKARKEKFGRRGAIIFFSIFGLVGAGMLYPLGIRPIMKTIDAESWAQVPCKIVSAEVKSHSDSDGTTYSIEITYDYEFEGRRYSSEKYGFMGGSSSGHKRKAKIVEGYKSAKNPVCFVNPAKPSEAVLKRGFHMGLLVALFPLPFMAVGLGGAIWAIKKGTGKGKLKPTVAKWLPEIKAEDAIGAMGVSSMPAGAVVMKPKHSPVGKLIGSIFVALFWNGIVSVFVVQVVSGWRSGDIDWFLTLFMIPFVVIGLLLIGMVFYFVLSLSNPRPRLSLSSSSVPLGGLMQLKWEFSGKSSMIQQLKIMLRGKEEARYRRGTKTYTDRNTFFEMEVYSTQDGREIGFGEVGLAVPSESMHSFEADNNKIIWEIEVHGDIAKWPDVKEAFKIMVLPAEMERV